MDITVARAIMAAHIATLDAPKTHDDRAQLNEAASVILLNAVDGFDRLADNFDRMRAAMERAANAMEGLEARIEKSYIDVRVHE